MEEQHQLQENSHLHDFGCPGEMESFTANCPLEMYFNICGILHFCWTKCFKGESWTRKLIVGKVQAALAVEWKDEKVRTGWWLLLENWDFSFNATACLKSCIIIFLSPACSNCINRGKYRHFGDVCFVWIVRVKSSNYFLCDYAKDYLPIHQRAVMHCRNGRLENLRHSA